VKAARELNYRLNFFARSLRVRRTYTIGVTLGEVGDAYGLIVISGIERYLQQRNVFFLTVAHRHDETLLATYSTIASGATGGRVHYSGDDLTEEQHLPTVAVAGHRNNKRVTNIVLDHRRPPRWHSGT
jgi:DNA-binding LacI/PurR family transcriptional regulator